MATMNDIVTGAARRIRQIGLTETLDSAEAAAFLAALNDMLSSWQADGIDIGWTAALKIGATFPMEAKHEQGVKALLGKRVSEDAGKPVTRQLDIDAKRGWNAILADYHLPDPMRSDAALANMPSQRRIIR